MCEVSLNANGHYQPENRVWLVGGEINWNQGKGHCRMKVDLHAGEISVKLGDK